MADHAPASRLETAHRWLFASPAGAVAITVVFAIAVGTLSLRKTFLHDEGIFTFSFARALWHDAPAILFVHKGKPLNILLEAPAAAFGFEAYLVWHLLLGATGIVAISGAARQLGLSHPNLAGGFLATSASYSVASANGYPNTVGAVLLSWFLYLDARGRARESAVLLGLLPLARYELAAVVAPYLVVRSVVGRNPRYLLWALAGPALYYVAGAFYWGDPLWLPRTLIDPNVLPRELHTWSHGFDLRTTVDYLGRALRANSPFLLPFALLAIRTRRSPVLLPVLVGGFLYISLTVMQLAELQKFALDLRHHVAGLPLAALAVAAGLSGEGARTAASGGRLAALGRLTLFALGTGLCVYLLGWGLPEEREQHERAHRLVHRLAERDIEVGGRRVYTDLYAAEQDGCAGFDDTRFLVNGAITWELEAATPGARRERTFDALRADGWLFHPDELPLDPDALYLISTEPRSAQWRTRLERAGATSVALEGWRAYRLASTGSE